MNYQLIHKLYEYYIIYRIRYHVKSIKISVRNIFQIYYRSVLSPVEGIEYVISASPPIQVSRNAILPVKVVTFILASTFSSRAGRER